MKTVRGIHSKCRGSYPGNTEVKRLSISDHQVGWNVSFPDYHPPYYTAQVVLNKPIWADPEITQEGVTHDIQFNSVDGKVNRVSFEGPYTIQDGLPLNVRGRTGLQGRGLLGRWGPNHAADPIVTRLADGSIEEKESKKVLEFVAIERKDCGEWAIPGGMVDPGESVSVTLKREFSEESMNSESMDEKTKEKVDQQLSEWFKDGLDIYKGYVDDPRNTDNAWMETVAMNFHDESGDKFGKLNLHAGDDAGKVQWITISKDLNLYASHADFIKQVAMLRDSYW